MMLHCTIGFPRLDLIDLLLSSVRGLTSLYLCNEKITVTLILLIILEGDSEYKFNFTWNPPVLKNGKNYTLDMFTEEKG